MNSGLYIAMVGLPARGKSTVSLRLKEGLQTAGIATEIFNNGSVRRKLIGKSSSLPDFYHPSNMQGRKQREEIARENMASAYDFLAQGGQVAILDATNASDSRRRFMESFLTNAPILYIECVNNDKELEKTCIENKSRLPEFSHLSHEEAVATFTQRIAYYRHLYAPLETEQNYIRVDAVRNTILEEHIGQFVPFYINIRDILVSEWVKDMFLARHGQSAFNVEERIGGDSSLTAKGVQQAQALAQCFDGKNISYLFTSTKKRSLETAVLFVDKHPEVCCIALPELDEIDSGVCDSLSYDEIYQKMPEVHTQRKADKFSYAYPQGESYASMGARVELGFRKALFLAGGQPGILFIGHQAVNRMILSLFLFRREQDVPYIYIPQDQYFHIVATHQKKLFELVPFGKDH